MAQKLYGISQIMFFKAENPDIDGNDANAILQAAKSEAVSNLTQNIKD